MTVKLKNTSIAFLSFIFVLSMMVIMPNAYAQACDFRRPTDCRNASPTCFTMDFGLLDPLSPTPQTVTLPDVNGTRLRIRCVGVGKTSAIDNMNLSYSSANGSGMGDLRLRSNNLPTTFITYTASNLSAPRRVRHRRNNSRADYIFSLTIAGGAYNISKTAGLYSDVLTMTLDF